MGITWDTPQARGAVTSVYWRVLQRAPDPVGLAHHISLLVGQNRTMRELVRGIGGSREYFDRFVAPCMPTQQWGTPITQYYRVFLDRAPESTKVLVGHSKQYVRHRPDFLAAHRALVNTFCGDEYLGRWGEQGVPGAGHNQPPPKSPPGPSMQGKQWWDVCVVSNATGGTYTTKAWGSSAQGAAAKLTADPALANVAGGVGFQVWPGPCG